MRKITFFFLLAFSHLTVTGQFNNSWIDYTQEYYKIPIAQSGTYRLTPTDLDNTGFPVNSVDPRWIRMYHRGIEQAIIVTGQQDARFDEGDYIEFYAERNDGTLDEHLYITPNDQPHKYYNLYSDTTAYFLTWSTGINGKRMSTYHKNNVDGLSAEPFHWESLLMVNTDEYAPGKSYGDYIQLTGFDTGEGWSGVAKQEGNSIDYAFSGINNKVTSSAKPSIEIQLVGRDDKQHQVQISLGQNASSLRVISTANFSLYDTHTITSEIEWSDISAGGDIVVRCNVQGVNGGNDLASVNYIKLVYPQQWNMSGQSNKWLTSRVNGSNESYLEISSTPTNIKIIDVTDKDAPEIIGHNTISGGVSAMIENTNSKRQLYCYSTVATPDIEHIEFNNYNLSEYDYVIVSHSSLMNSGGVYANPIQAYADYRGTDKGGNFNVLVLEVGEVFNQYGYGEFSPVAVRNFLEKWVNVGYPKGLFLVGKSILIGSKTNLSGVNYHYRNNPEMFVYKDLIPTAGRPGSDLHYGMGLMGNTDELDVPIGRITASTPDQVAAYLDKVKESEGAKYNALWKKNILHLSGGLTSDELVRFESHVNGFKSKAEDLYLGGDVTSVRKQSNNTVEFINTTDQINSGLNLITFFGHSAPNIVDIDIGYASDPIHGYENKGKYPVILVNGCSAGQVFGNNYLWGEDWVLAPELGSLGFIAHTYYGYEGYLRNYTNIFYDKAFGDSTLIYKPIGNIFQEVIKEYRSIYGTSPVHEGQTVQMILVGDPVLHLFNANAPDYAIENEDLFFVPYINGNVDALVDSFAIGAVVRNYGRADNDPIKVRIERILEDNTTIYYDSVFNPVFYQDTLYVNIFNEGSNYAGRNKFKLIIDYDKEVPELDDTNNSAQIDINLTLNGTKNLFPSQYAVVNKQHINLILQSSNVLNQDKRGFIIEIDTINTFDSPYKQKFEINGEVLLNESIELLPQDSLVYYWRTKFKDPQIGENIDWTSSSFTYIKNGQPGWMQSHYQQVVDNEFNRIQFDVTNGNLSFEQLEVQFDLQIYGASNPTDDYTAVMFEIDGLPYIYPSRLCRDNAINLVAFSKETGIPYISLPSGVYNPNSCGRQSQVINNFTYSQIVNSGSVSVTNGDNMLELYLDNIPEGDYVLLFTTGDIQFNNWSTELRGQLERIGGNTSTLAALSAGEPFILFGTKGASAGEALEILTSGTPVDEQTLTLTKTVNGIISTGSVISTLIGPATVWKSFKNNVKVSEFNALKDYSFDIYGVNYNGTTTLEYQGIQQNEIDISNLDSNEKPFIKVVLNLMDPINQTASQLNFWQVEFEGVPEGVLLLGDNPDGYELEKQEGEQFLTNFRFVNVSENNYSIDSLNVKQSDYNVTFGGVPFFQDLKIKAPKVGDTTLFTVLTDTKSKIGQNNFHLDVNYYLVNEQYFDNNSLILPEYFDVYQDMYNPLLQVHFDGVPIANGAIVSAKPVIEISIWDENPYLAKNDTTGIQMFLKQECEECKFEEIKFSSDVVNWFYSEVENRINIDYTPFQLQNGKYTFKVLAEDMSGNQLADIAYEIQFEVINEPSLTNFYVFPNPLTTGVRFSYQLTGSTLPDVMKIEILNLEGEVVRSISQAEFGEIRIGQHVSEFQWNGSDQSGNLLPSGLYLYKLTAYKDGKNLITRQTSSDRGFNNGIGKIYIIR